MSHRLPTTVRPQRYDLHLRLDPARDDFAGEVTIQAQAVEATDEIILHAKDLDIHSATLTPGAPGARSAPQTAHVSLHGDRVTLHVATKMPAGPVAIQIRYTGRVRHDMAGLYLSKDGERTCLATQCEATDARTIVPCWDEPEYKAQWQWTITAPTGLHALANGALTASTAAGATTTHTFAATPPMSSYLIACCVGDFAATPAVTARGKPFRVWAMRGQERHGEIGNGYAVKMLPWYEDYFGHEYAFGKYDQIAVPSFAFGAMENAGLVLFRPSLVLMDEATAGWDDRRHVALVVAHEFAHMWFGNLVTMAWWDDLWLNEAFAEWIAHKCVASLEPELDVWVPFRQRAGGALSTDSLASTHAIYHPVKTPEEAQEMFDAVTYGKGSAVMRMLESYLGEEVFCAGLRTYMQAFRFGNAQGRDLWEHLSTASGQDIAGIMGDWVTQAGHPTVTVRVEDGRLYLTQARTVSSPLAEVHATRWRIPLVVRYADSTGTHELRHVMSAQDEDIDLPVAGNVKWLWPNAHDGGFYRCVLDDALMHRALDNAPKLAPAERVALLRDLWMQVRAGKQPVSRFLDAFTSLLDGTDHYEVVEHQTAVARMLDGLLRGEARDAFRHWLGHRLDAALDLPATTPADRQRRAAVLRGLGTAMSPRAVAAAKKLAAKERADPAGVDAELAGAAIAVEAMSGDPQTLETHLATYRARRDGEASPQEVERYVYALAGFRDEAAVARVLRLLVEQGVSAQAEGPILRAMLASPYVGRAAWEHVKQHWDETAPRLGEAWLAIIVEACGELPIELASEVTAFWDARLDGHAAQSYGRAKERLRERAELEKRIGAELAQWAETLVVDA